jgi:hypothetical protein
MLVRSDPGPCPICGAAHTACTSGAGPITSVMAPARDASAVLVAEQVQATLPPGQFTTGTYRGEKKKR